MSITSSYFWIFLIISVIIYYAMPVKKWQWSILLCTSMVFFFAASGFKMFFYLLSGALIAWGGGLLLSRYKDKKIGRSILIIILLLLIGELAALKYVQSAIVHIAILAKLANLDYAGSEFAILAPIGISYYTLAIVGYVLDVYWETVPAQKNPLKMLLFTAYFPQMTSGPITRYKEMETQLFAEHRFDHTRILYGIQRILWGMFKKIVIADRIAIYVSAVYDDYIMYPGCYIVVAVVLFAFQLYCDFSGCMDIVCGASECFGIYLPENFKSPFLSESVSEFWRRWHITMGNWFKDYLLYPILKSGNVQKIKKIIKKYFGKKAGKNIPTYFGMLVVWLSIGIWHGGQLKYIFASGFLPGFYLIMGEICTPLFKKTVQRFHIRTDVLSWRIFRKVRTFLCMCTSWVFIRAVSFREGLKVIKSMIAVKNPVILFDGYIYLLGLTWKDFNVITAGILLILIVDLANEHGIAIREKLREQNLWAQWFVMLAALFTILILGIYGPGYDPVDFIYKNF